eukprot:COSAG01_NODE_289_length_19391_cov_119.323122_19_plen_163_part_00
MQLYRLRTKYFVFRDGILRSFSIPSCFLLAHSQTRNSTERRTAADSIGGPLPTLSTIIASLCPFSSGTISASTPALSAISACAPDTPWSMLNAATLSISCWLLPTGSVVLCVRTRLPSTLLVRRCFSWRILCRRACSWCPPAASFLRRAARKHEAQWTIQRR